jgi:hypothetical protein
MTAKESPLTSNQTKSTDDSDSIRSFRSTATDDFPLEIFEDSNIPTMGEIFQKAMNNGAADNVACFKLIVMLILFLAALIIGNAAFVFTSQEINDKYAKEVRYPCWIQYSCFDVCVTQYCCCSSIYMQMSLSLNPNTSLHSCSVPLEK